MGQANSSSYVKESVYVTADLINKSYQDCGTVVNQVQEINIDHCDHVDVRNIKMNQVFKLDQSCVEADQFSNSVDQSVESAVKQATEALVKDYGIGQANANSVTEQMENITTVISNSFVQDCSMKANMEQQLQCKYSDYVVFDNINMEQTIDAHIQCVSDHVVDNSSTQAIINTIDQETKATVSGINPLILLVILVVIAGLAGGGMEWIFVKEAEAVTDPKVAIGQLVVVGIILLVVWLTNSWWIFKPFKEIWNIMYKLLKSIGDLVDLTTKLL